MPHSPPPTRNPPPAVYILATLCVVLAAAVIVLGVLLVQKDGDSPTAARTVAPERSANLPKPASSLDDGRKHYTSTCTVDASSQKQSYVVTITNESSSLLTVNGFVVIFTDASGAQVSSDSEPGGRINDSRPITLSEPIGASQTVAFDVEPSDPIMDSATDCTVGSVRGH